MGFGGLLDRITYWYINGNIWNWNVATTDYLGNQIILVVAQRAISEKSAILESLSKKLKKKNRKMGFLAIELIIATTFTPRSFTHISYCTIIPFLA